MNKIVQTCSLVVMNTSTKYCLFSFLLYGSILAVIINPYDATNQQRQL